MAQCYYDGEINIKRDAQSSQGSSNTIAWSSY